MAFSRSFIALGFGIALTSFAAAQAVDQKQQADARTRVQVATALAQIAETDKDGDAMLVAAKLLASAGHVAAQGAEVKDGKPTLYAVGDLVAKAKELGADAAKAEEVAKMTVAPTSTSPTSGYWYYSCDSYNNCQWIYVGY